MASHVFFGMISGVRVFTLHSLLFPELFSFAKDGNISVHKAHSTSDLHELFHLTLTPESFDQYL